MPSGRRRPIERKPYRMIVHGVDAPYPFGDAAASWRQVIGVIAAAVLAIAAVVAIAPASR